MKRSSIPLALVALLLLVSAVPAGAGPDESEVAQGYKLSWWTVDSGGGTFTGSGGHTLSGTIGQPDASISGGVDYSLSGGFWAWSGEYAVRLPLVLRGY